MREEEKKQKREGVFAGSDRMKTSALNLTESKSHYTLKPHPPAPFDHTLSQPRPLQPNPGFLLAAERMSELQHCFGFALLEKWVSVCVCVR